MPPVLPPIEINSKELSFSDEQVKIPSLVMDFKNLSIQELLDHCLRTDDQAGWKEFVERITPTICGVAYNTWNNHSGRCDPDVIQDLIQKTLLKLFDKEKKALHEFVPEHENSFYGYVRIITRNVVLDEVRKPQREDPLEEALEFTAGGAFSDRAPLNHLLLREVEQRLEKLTADEEEKGIFWLYFRSGYTAKEIAEMPEIKLSIRRVEAILYRLVRQLRRGFGRGASE